MVSLARQIMQIGVRNRDMQPSIPEEAGIEARTEAIRKCNSMASQAHWFVEQMKRQVANTAFAQRTHVVEGALELDRAGYCRALEREDEFGTDAMLVAVETYVRRFGSRRFNRDYLPGIVRESIAGCREGDGIWGDLVRILIKYLLLTMHCEDSEYQYPMLEVICEMVKSNPRIQPELCKALSDGMKMFCCFAVDPLLASHCYAMFRDIHSTLGAVGSDDSDDGVRACRAFYADHRLRHANANAHIGRKFIESREEASRLTRNACGDAEV